MLPYPHPEQDWPQSNEDQPAQASHLEYHHWILNCTRNVDWYTTTYYLYTDHEDILVTSSRCTRNSCVFLFGMGISQVIVSKNGMRYIYHIPEAKMPTLPRKDQSPKCAPHSWPGSENRRYPNNCNKHVNNKLPIGSMYGIYANINGVY